MSNVAPGAQGKAVEVVKPGIMSIEDAMALEQKQASECDYYAVYLIDQAADEVVRVRTPVWFLDEDRNPIVDKDGKRQLRHPVDVGLDVWAAYGTDSHDLFLVMRGPSVVATPSSIVALLQIRQTVNQSQQAE